MFFTGKSQIHCVSQYYNSVLDIANNINLYNISNNNDNNNTTTTTTTNNKTTQPMAADTQGRQFGENLCVDVVTNVQL